MTYEKRLASRALEPFTADSSRAGQVNVANTNGFKVKQKVIIVATSLTPLELEIKQIDSISLMWVGPVSPGKITARTDISAYTVALGAGIFANEQPRPSVPQQEIERHTYEEEPVVARRVFIVDELGNPWNETNPLPVDVVVNVDELNVELDAKDGDNTAISAHPNPIFDEQSDTITTDDWEEIYSYTSTDSLTRIQHLHVAISTPSILRVKVGLNTIREYRTSPMKRNAEIFFTEHRPLMAGQTITVEAKVERKIWPNYTTFTSLEGYIA